MKAIQHIIRCNREGYFIKQKPRWTNKGLYTEPLSKQKILDRFPGLVIEDHPKYAFNVENRFMISGTADGFAIDKKGNRYILEYKERSARLLGVKPYEVCQVNWYMKLSGIHKCIFIESYDDESQIFMIDYDEDSINEQLPIIKDKMALIRRV